jgi:YVTN family beta-propeller protein
MFRILRFLGPFLLMGMLFSLVSCSDSDSSTPDPSTLKATLYSFSNSSPNITEIDAETNTILRTADIPDLVKLAWNDDGNYFDGTDLWVTARNPEEKTSELIFLNLETLTVTDRLALGSNPANVYLGVGNLEDGVTSNGEIFVGLQGNMDQAGEVVVVDAKKREILSRISVNQIACDVDTSVGADGVQRLFVPNQKMDAVQNFDAKSHALLNTLDQPEGSNPFMLTVTLDGKHVWVQDGNAGTNSVLDAVTLETIKRIPTGEGPVVASFSPDGKYGYVGHYKATTVTVIDTQTHEIIKQVEVGASPSKLAAHPNGKYVYAVVTKENALAVINTSTWTVDNKITLESSPGGLYLLTRTE